MSVTQKSQNPGMTMKAISFAVLLVTVTGIAFYLAQHREVFDKLRVIPVWSGLPLFILGVLALTANGLYLKIFARKFDLDLRAREWFGLAAVTAMGNYLTPLSGGLMARAAYLKLRHEFPYSRFLAMLAANYLIAFAVIGAAGTVVMLTRIATGGFSWPVLLLFAATVLAVPLVLRLPPGTGTSGGRILRFVQSALEGLAVIRRDRTLLGKLVALTLWNVSLGAALYFAVFRVIGAPIPLALALLLHLLTSYTVLINLTPGNLGVQEIVTGVAASVLGAGAETGLLAALIVRAVTTLCAFALGPIFSYLLSKELADRDAARRASGENRTVSTRQGS